jgi:AcrR family transcriptional regulator
VSAPAAAVAGGRRAATKAANRAAILTAACEVFGETGYGSAGVRDIVRRTDLAAGTFYNYFPDKESVFRALVQETVDEARARVAGARARAAARGVGGRRFVEEAYRAYFEFIVEDPARHAFMRRNLGTIRLTFDGAGLPEASAELADDLRAAIERGDLPAVDVDYTVGVMIAVGLELGGRLIERDPPDVAGATRFATGLFLGGLEAAAGG